MLCARVLFLVLAHYTASAVSCMGEYQACLDGSCSLFECNADGTAAAGCNAGAYLCPLPSPATGDWHCVDDATALLSGCPGVNGTHLDHTLPIDTRIDILAQRTNLTEQISQLTNGAPALRRHGIPAYNWLSDDEHGVRGTATTYFPDGPGLGASWDKHLLLAVGSVVGKEARAQHNSYQGGRAGAFNGAGITVYGPNMNLVRDPRWGRAQEVYSEDPRLSAALTVGYVTGIQQGAGAAAGRHDNPRQGDHGNGTTGTVYRQAAACCKHYVAYDIEGNGPLPSRVFQDSQVDTRCFWCVLTCTVLVCTLFALYCFSHHEPALYCYRCHSTTPPAGSITCQFSTPA